MICIIEGCDAPARGLHGMCNRHRLRLQRHGDPLWTARAEKACSVDNCPRRVHGHGLYDRHYRRWKRHGSVDGTGPGEPMDFLLATLTLNLMGCPARNALNPDVIRWPYAHTNGYPKMYVDGRLRYVHEMVCEWWHGPRPSPLHVASHKCGNGHLGCYSPGDLKWQTRSEDFADMVRHGTKRRKTRVMVSVPDFDPEERREA